MSALDVRNFLDRWAKRQEERDIDGCADLFLRDPEPVVVFSDGERCEDWLDVRIRLSRDLARVVVERVEVHGLVTRDVADGVAVASFDYDLRVRDTWGSRSTVARHATMTLAWTKDGYRIATAHFSR